MLAEPVLSLCCFATAGTEDLPEQLVLAITPTSVHAYALTTAGDIAHELATWSRATLLAETAAPSGRLTLSLTGPGTAPMKLLAVPGPGSDAFVALILRRV